LVLFFLVSSVLLFLFSGTYKRMHSVRTRRVAGHLDISARGMLAIGDGTFVDVYGCGILDAPQADPYMSVHTGERKEVVHSVRFCPWEDVLGVGRAGGFTSAIIPGCGEPNIDTFEANPFITRQQRREADVQSLLDKAQPNTIMLNPNELGGVDAQAVPKAAVKEKEKFQPKHKSGGKDKSGQRQKRKAIVSDAEFLQERRQQVLEERQKEEDEAKAEQEQKKQKKKKKKFEGDVLARFVK
jgi:U3 small nucleolar RNA-associated protein 7